MGIPAIGDNYDIIWDCLIEKYDDPRPLANFYFEQILEFKPILHPTADCLNKFVETFDNSYRALQKLEIIRSINLDMPKFQIHLKHIQELSAN